MSINRDTENKKKILFIYTGYEQGSWGNSAYSCNAHYYIMPGILYCAISLGNDSEINDTCMIRYRFFNRTIESREDILHYLTKESWDLVGFSTYCWNREDHLYLAEKLKIHSPQTVIIFGGPEIHLENSNETSSFFKENPFVDCLVFGDAENKLAAIVTAVFNKNECLLDGITGFSLVLHGKIVQNFDLQPPLDLTTVPSIYPFDISIPHSTDSGLAMVYESGRGCPYRCIFCKFGHGGARMQRIPLSRVKQELQWLMSRKIECIHFADAVFDLQPDYAKSVCTMILENNITSSIFFYCSFLKLDKELALLFEKTQCQIGVGIQSTNPAALKTMQRAPNTAIFENIRQILIKHQINFYTDIIFGLPMDNPNSFAETFNNVITLNPAFIMAFPLSLIKGTELTKKAERYGMIKYPERSLGSLNLMCDIEYRNIALYKDFTDADLEEFDDIALTLFYFYNRFFYTLSYLLHRTAMDPFTLYQTVGRKTKEFLRKTGRIASNTNMIDGFQDEIIKIFSDVITEESVGDNEYNAFKELFKLDLFRILILSSPHRKKLFNASYDRRKSGMVNLPEGDGKNMHAIKIAYGKMLSLPYRFSDLQRLHEVKDSIDRKQDLISMYAPFNHWNVTVDHPSRLERFLIELVPENRAMRLNSIIQAAQHQFRSAKSASEITPDTIKNSLELLIEHEIILIYND